ncbi:MAG TPA: accessory Sec system S-layer assembly protein [Bacilli bacterium]|nr:accessory Sec system S-layer assembly protein [Bacilli bacterium]
MLSFFKKQDGEKPTLDGQESVVQSSELLPNEEESEHSEEEVETTLSLHPEWTISKEDQYAFQFLNMECPPLKRNQISLSGISLTKESEEVFRVTAFIRNSIDRPIQFEETTLALLDEDGKILGRKQFDLREAGEIPAHSARPWNFYFSHKDLFTTELPAQGWQLAFQIESLDMHRLELEESWEKSLATGEKEYLKEVFDRLEPPKKGEFNIIGLQATKQDNGELHVLLFIRNGSNKRAEIEQLPLQIVDAVGDVVATGSFKLEKFTVNPNTSKPWSFIFPASLVQKENPDFSRWSARPLQNNN